MVIFHAIAHGHHRDCVAVGALFECTLHSHSCRATTRWNYRAAKCLDRVVYSDLLMVTDVARLDVTDCIVFVVSVYRAGDIPAFQRRWFR